LIFTETKLAGHFVIEPERRADKRGFFARDLLPAGVRGARLNPDVVSGTFPSTSARNAARNALSGKPFAEVKTGAVHFRIDLDVHHPTCGLHRRPLSNISPRGLSAENRRMLYIPEDFAHGFQTLQDDTEVFYQMAQGYSRGTRPRSSLERSSLWD